MEEILIGNAGSALLKSGMHKYVKRTGSSGNYKYWYKGPGGKLVSGKKPDEDAPGGGDREAEARERQEDKAKVGKHFALAGKLQVIKYAGDKGVGFGPPDSKQARILSWEAFQRATGKEFFTGKLTEASRTGGDVKFKPGQTVRFKEEGDPGDDKLRFRVLEDNGDRVLVEHTESSMAIKPTATYRKTELTLADK